MVDTKVLKGKEALQLGSTLIKNGNVVVFPTETVYGLGANAFDESAVKKIFEVKGRPQDNPLIIHIADKNQIDKIAKKVTNFARIVIDKFMPGPITVILEKNDIVPNVVTANLNSVGIRMPKHKMARDLIKMACTPIAAPSANISTHISPTNANDVYEDLKGRVQLIMDGGDCSIGIESTILDLTKEIPVILRPGAITAKMLTNALGVCQMFSGEVKVALAPGMKYKHYAPNCEMIIAAEAHIEEQYLKQQQLGKNPIVLCEDKVAKKLSNLRYINLGAGGKNIMKNIFATMHEAQKISDYIICQDFGTKGVRLSVMNRVLKAAGGVKI